MWYCLSGNEKYGPFSIEEASLFIQSHPDCLVWREGMPEWVPANKFSILTNHYENLPAEE